MLHLVSATSSAWFSWAYAVCSTDGIEIPIIHNYLFSFLLAFIFSLGLTAAFVELSCCPGKLTIESGAYVMVLKAQPREKNSQDKLQDIFKGCDQGGWGGRGE